MDFFLGFGLLKKYIINYNIKKFRKKHCFQISWGLFILKAFSSSEN